MDLAFNIANNSFKTQVYNTPGRYTYTIPNGVSMVYILAMGSGGGGGGGFTRTVSPVQAGGGGGGGGTAAISRLIIPRIFLSNSLTVRVLAGGNGGNGGNPATAGSAGNETDVWLNLNPQLNPSTTNPFVLNAQGGGGGGAGSATVGGTAGAQGGTTLASIMKIASLGEFTNRIGITGDVGGFPTANNLLYGGGSIPFSSGRGGGGINAANPGTARSGSGITGRGFVPDIDGGTAGNGVAGGNGSNGIFQMKPFFSLSGIGGGSSNSGNGGNGGIGASGTGGGGGGAGTSPGVGGNGGKGGDGLVIIVCW